MTGAHNMQIEAADSDSDVSAGRRRAQIRAVQAITGCRLVDDALRDAGPHELGLLNALESAFDSELMADAHDPNGAFAALHETRDEPEPDDAPAPCACGDEIQEHDRVGDECGTCAYIDSIGEPDDAPLAVGDDVEIVGPLSDRKTFFKMYASDCFIGSRGVVSRCAPTSNDVIVTIKGESKSFSVLIPRSSLLRIPAESESPEPWATRAPDHDTLIYADREVGTEEACDVLNESAMRQDKANAKLSDARDEIARLREQVERLIAERAKAVVERDDWRAEAAVLVDQRNRAWKSIERHDDALKRARKLAKKLRLWADEADK